MMKIAFNVLSAATSFLVRHFIPFFVKKKAYQIGAGYKKDISMTYGISAFDVRKLNLNVYG